jgi:hypothetical protein
MKLRIVNYNDYRDDYQEAFVSLNYTRGSQCVFALIWMNFSGMVFQSSFV